MGPISWRWGPRAYRKQVGSLESISWLMLRNLSRWSRTSSSHRQNRRLHLAKLKSIWISNLGKQKHQRSKININWFSKVFNAWSGSFLDNRWMARRRIQPVITIHHLYSAGINNLADQLISVLILLCQLFPSISEEIMDMLLTIIAAAIRENTFIFIKYLFIINKFKNLTYSILSYGRRNIFQ